MITRLIAAILFSTATLSARALAPIQPETLETYSRSGKIITYELPYKHLNHASFEDPIATNALNRFISLLDFDRTYFLASDIEAFQTQATNLDERLKSGDLSVALDIYEVFMTRASNRIDFVESILDTGFDLEEEESYEWRRKELPWAASEEEWDDLWRMKVKNQYVARVVAERLAEEKKAREEAEKKADSVEAEKTDGETQADSDGNQAQAYIPGEDESQPDAQASSNANAEAETEYAADIELEMESEPDVERVSGSADEVNTENVDVDVVESEDAPGTEGSDESETVLPAPPKLTPKEAIRKEYRQYLSVLNDNDAHWLLPLYISSFVNAYDPHSDYMSQNSTEDFDISMKLSLVGIGALLSSEDGAAKIVRIIPGGPAEKDGRLQPGDKIVAVGQDQEEPVDILHWPLSKSVRKIRGEKNTRVVLHVIPASDISGSTIKVVDLIRDEVKLEERAAKGRVTTVKDAEGTDHTIGIISIPDFYADINARNDSEARLVTRDVQTILNNLATNHIEGLILDLRNNGGGSLTEAVELTGLFIDSGPVVQVKTEERVITLPDSDPTIAYAGPLLVLVNRQSA
ncbi:MAG: S41 family peptidase, partial [Kiritimatiellae bacterium]|nr:S41 family peptidase [Kiritimatiellia bacterium]